MLVLVFKHMRTSSTDFGWKATSDHQHDSAVSGLECIISLVAGQPVITGKQLVL